MSVFVSLYTSESKESVEVKLNGIRISYDMVYMGKFLLSEVLDISETGLEIALEHNFFPTCRFVITLNDKSVADLVGEVVFFIKKEFEDGKILALINNEVVI